MPLTTTTCPRGSQTAKLPQGLETLEDRLLAASALPTAYEQYMLELVNNARRYPAATAAALHIALNEGLPAGKISTAAKQPLAFDPKLIYAARGHSKWMIAAQKFDHYGPNGATPGTRMAAAGFSFAPPSGWGENIAVSQFSGPVSQTSVVLAQHKDLFVDRGIAGRGHRLNILNAPMRKIGIGYAKGVYQGWPVSFMCTQDYAYAGSQSFLTGVAYDDGKVKADRFYTPGEGFGSVKITARRASDGRSFSTTTWGSGGYTLALPSGTYTVTATGSKLGTTMKRTNVRIGAVNVKVDFVK